MELSWEDYKIVIYSGLIILGVIILDEIAYRGWKIYNPGHMYSHLNDKTAPLVDPSAPPTTQY